MMTEYLMGCFNNATGHCSYFSLDNFTSNEDQCEVSKLVDIFHDVGSNTYEYVYDQSDNYSSAPLVF